ncbi:MAG: hypothetical protein ACJAS4_003738 [Bacteriovoracaceae bacterium]|jgi:hypothetical protein
MKKLNKTIAIITLMSFTSCLVPEKAVEISQKIGVSGTAPSMNFPNTKTAPPKKEFDPINSKYTKRDFAGCFTALAIVPVVLVTEALINVLTLKIDVDAYINQNTIDLVAKDLDAYILENGKISPEEFWNSLSMEAHDSLISDLIPSYNRISSENFNEKKKIMAYAFLYYLEAGSPESSYHFTFDDRESDEPRFIREYISFGGSRKIKDAIDVGICGYFRLSDINVETNLLEDNGIKSKILCENQHGSKVVLSENFNNEIKLEVKFKSKNSLNESKPKIVTMNLNDIDVDANRKNVDLEYSLGWNRYPKVYIDIEKRFQTNENGEKGHYVNNSAKTMDVQIKYNVIQRGDRLKNLNCREVKAFTFE